MSMKNMVAMFGAMAVLQRIDQEEPLVLLYARLGYMAYFAVVSLIYVILHFRIVARRDETLVTVPVATKGPSLSDAFEQFKKASEKAEQDRLQRENGDNESTTSSATTANASDAGQAARLPSNSSSDTSTSLTTNASSGNADNEATEATADATTSDAEQKEETETITTMEYDLRQLATARRSWATSSCFLAAIHYHLESVSPLFMSAVMGFVRLVTEDQLVQIHVFGAPAVGKLTRPFAVDKNPLAAMLKEFGPKTDERPHEREETRPGVEEDLHDDGEDDDDDETPVAIVDMKDDHIKSDFDDEETAEQKKTQ